jgi:aliphatic nitrilase
MRFYKELFKNAVAVPSPATDQIGQAAKKARAYVIMGINEKEANTYGTLYNTFLFFGPDGELLGKHRKLMPTLHERLVHTGGDGSTLEVFDTVYGRLSGLICGEHSNPLARFALLAKGEVIHVAGWPAFALAQQANVIDGIDIRIRAHAYEGRIFVLSSTGVFTDEMKDAMELDETARNQFVGDGAHSCIVNPHGQFLVGPDVHGETVLCADLDMEEIVAAKYVQDITGHYNRFDVLTLQVNRATHYPLTESNDVESRAPSSGMAYVEPPKTDEEKI